jgi:DNA-binding CsgD family transcriptional regulator
MGANDGRLRWEDDPRLGLIDAAYAGAASGDWSEFVERLAGCLHGRIGFRLQSADLRQVRLAHEMLAPEYVASYTREFAALDPWRVQVSASERDRWARLPIIFTDEILDRAETEKTAFYADWMRPQRLSHSARCRISRSDGEHLDLLVLRERGAPDFSEHDRAVLATILPHLNRSVQIAGRMGLLQAQAAGVIGALDRTGVGVLVVRADGFVETGNPAAENILRLQSGLALRGDRLIGAGAVAGKMAQALALATERRGRRRGSSFSLPRPEAGAAVSVAVLPLDEPQAAQFGDSALALVVLSAPELQPAPDREALRALYGLTPAEARLVSALCRGQTVQSHAAGTGTSLTTAKTHLRSAFAKTGERRQADLILRIRGDTALAMSPGEDDG